MKLGLTGAHRHECRTICLTLPKIFTMRTETPQQVFLPRFSQGFPYSAFPFRYIAIDNSKYRMRRRNFSATGERPALFELPLEMFPFVTQLSISLTNFSTESLFHNFPPVKLITPFGRFSVNCSQIARNRRHRLALRPEPGQLRMVPVATRLPAQNFLRQQRFAPQRHQTAHIQMSRMNRPKSHFTGTIHGFLKTAIETGGSRAV